MPTPRNINRKPLALLLVAIIAVSTTSIIYTMFQERSKGIKIVFKNLNNKNLVTGAVGGTKTLGRVEVQVEAILPTGPNYTETIFLGFLNDSKLFLDAENPKFKKVLEAWVNLYELEELKENLKTSLIVSVWIFNETGVYRPVPDIVIEYKPIEALKGLVVKTVTIDSKTLEKIDESISSRVKNGWGGTVIYVWGKDPDLSWEPTNYIQVPLLIVKNDASYSASIIWSIIIEATYETWFKITLSYGFKIEDKAKNQEYDTIDLKVYSTGTSIGDSKWSFYQNNCTEPEEAKWVYIEAIPVHLHYKEYKCVYWHGHLISKTTTGNEKMEDKIVNVHLSGVNIEGGTKNGLPECIDEFYDGTTEENPYIPDTSLSDGKLDVGESIAFSEIFNYYDVYENDFEIGIPVGSLAAQFAGLPSFIEPVVKGLCISLSWGETATRYVNGGLQNHGDYPAGYDIWERIYVRVSKYQYTYGNYEFKVPAGIYFGCW